MKVLIIGEVFHELSGGGITLQSLFAGIEDRNIAFIETASNLAKLGEEKRFQTYALGIKEVGALSIVKKYLFGNKIIKNESKLKNRGSNISGKNKSSLTNLINSLVLTFKRIVDFFDINKCFVVKLSDQVIDFVNTFNPNVIYIQPNSYLKVEFVNKLNKLTQKPIIIHFMDDYATVIDRGGFLGWYFHRRYKKSLNMLISNSYSRFVICEEMKDAYEKRYRTSFHVLHNSVQKDFWENNSKNNEKVFPHFKLLHAGRMTFPVENVLLKITEAINLLNETKEYCEVIKFHIYSHDQYRNRSITNRLLKYDFVSIEPPVSYNQMPKLLSEYDCLLLPLDFDKKTIVYTRYSFSTKVPEYIFSKRPICVIAPKETALCKSAKKYKWAYVIESDSVNDIKDRFKDFLTKPEMRKNQIERAIVFAKQEYSKEKLIFFRKTLEMISN